MSVKNETHRIFLRGETAKFVVYFFEDAGQTVPITPLDSGEYPAYTIYDMENTVIQSGVGTPEATPGRYKVEFLVPPDAPLSSDKSRWRIEWVIVSDNDRQVDFVEEFDIKDTVITASESREQKYISLVNSEYRAFVRLPEIPDQIALDVFPVGILTKIVDNAATGGLTGIKESVDGDSIVYYYDIAPELFGPYCDFALIWKIRNTVSEPQSFLYHSLSLVTPQCLYLITSLRMLIDKLQKRLGTVQAYEDSECVEYLKRGAELVNAHYPTTYFGYSNIPQVLTVHHILYSAWYALQAQQLLSTELAFSFSGQTVTLEYDQASGLADLAGRWQDFLTETLSATKMAIVRQGSPVGVVAGRQYRISSPYNLTYKVGTLQGGVNQFVGQLVTLGLLF